MTTATKPLTHAQLTKAQFDRLPPTLKKVTPVMWACSCGEMWSGRDIERDVHVHGAFEAGTHRISGPLFRDKAAEADVRAGWAKEDTDD